MHACHGIAAGAGRRSMEQEGTRRRASAAFRRPARPGARPPLRVPPAPRAPALVDTLPAMWQLPLAPRSSGMVKPRSARNSSRTCSTQPAWATSTPDAWGHGGEGMVAWGRRGRGRRARPLAGQRPPRVQQLAPGRIRFRGPAGPQLAAPCSYEQLARSAPRGHRLAPRPASPPPNLVERYDLVHRPEAQHDLVKHRHAAADEAGVAALRHDRQAARVAVREDAGDLVGRGRAQRQLRAAVVLVHPVAAGARFAFL